MEKFNDQLQFLICTVPIRSHDSWNLAFPILILKKTLLKCHFLIIKINVKQSEAKKTPLYLIYYVLKWIIHC